MLAKLPKVNLTIFSRMGEALVKKDLREPSNWNILFDFLLILFILGLCLFGGVTLNDAFLWTCVVIGFVFILLCFGWIIYYTGKKRDIRA